MAERESVLKARYVEDKKAKNEQDLWEEHQTAKSSLKYGAGDKKEKSGVKQYDYVFEDQIDFIQQEIVQGQEPDKEVKKADLQAEAQTEYEKIQVQRKLLPIYPYRDGE
jgi:pre-mRNA-splicing factor ATP-dependent RNA helicase DHX16